MTELIAISMEEPCQRLAKLEDYIPDDASDGLLYEYGRFLADYFNPELDTNIIGFYLKCNRAFFDLQKGIYAHTGEPIQSRLSNCPPVFYSLLRMELPCIADAIFPEDFAQEVKQYIEEVENSR